MNCRICHTPVPGRRTYCDQHLLERRQQHVREMRQSPSSGGVDRQREGQIRKLERVSKEIARDILTELDTNPYPPPPVVAVPAWQPWQARPFGYTLTVNR